MKQTYKVHRIRNQFTVDGKWKKKPWLDIESLEIMNSNGWIMNFKPITKVKMCYDAENIYLIYHVEDRYVRCVTKEINGPVWQDSCVEFFIAPNIAQPNNYFNIEINCGGTALMSYQMNSTQKYIYLPDDEIRRIKIFSSLPRVIENEIDEPVMWTIEVRLPIDLLKEYSALTLPTPERGAKWKANFFKCAEINSHPHWLSWTEIKSEQPNFHLPEFFGEIEFM